MIKYFLKNKLHLTALIVLSTCVFVNAQVIDVDYADKEFMHASDDDMQWWLNAHFGVFMHWGPASFTEKGISWGRFGPRPGHSSKHATKGTPAEEYDNLYKKFNPVKFDAKEWVQMIKDAGAKYFIFTAKHHDGFCMFDSKYTDYDIMSTPFKRDVCKELAEECHKQGIKLFWYYSQPDWHHPLYLTDKHDEYIEYLHNQIRELCTNYGELGGIWFDGLGKHPDNWDAENLIKMIRELQPKAIINPRFARKTWHWGDFDTPEQTIGAFQIDRPWETCMTMGGPWSWGGKDRNDTKSADYCTRVLINCAGGGGNLALNTGPSPEGEIFPQDIENYLQMGKWLEKYGESIYGTRGGPYKPGPWGVSARKDNKIYLHIMQNWPGGELKLPALPAKILNAKALAGGKVDFSQNDDELTIKLSPDFHKKVSTVIVLELDKNALDITVIESSKKSLTVGQTPIFSSEDKKFKASHAFASVMDDFEEGAYHKSHWRPSSKDSNPWIGVSFEKSKTFQNIVIKERKTDLVNKFIIEIKQEGGNWKEIYDGTWLGEFSLLLEKPVTAKEVRIVFGGSRQKPFGISSIDIY